jgi:signal transduction histidine kinase
VFFCCSEALQNAAKHAGRSASARVRLSHSDAWVEFRVEDDGDGFDPHTVTRGRGLDNMRDRVAALGGSVTLASVVGQGTRVSGRLPADG